MDNKSDVLGRKRNFSEFNSLKSNEIQHKNDKNVPSSKNTKESNGQNSLTNSEEKHFHKLYQKKNFKNLFSFIRRFMRNSSLEILNLFEVSNVFMDKLSEFDLQSKNHCSLK
jgi:hypothetical protein